MKDDKHHIELAAATELTHRWQRSHPDAPRAMGFDRAAIERVLRQDDCHGIRIYYAELPDGNWTVVLVGTDKESRDLANGEIAELAVPCPPLCDKHSPFQRRK